MKCVDGQTDVALRYALIVCILFRECAWRCQWSIPFFQARDAGVALQKWLMVNVQNVLEFSCQILNRDIWSNKAINTVIKEHFIFWQVSFVNSSCLQIHHYFISLLNLVYLCNMYVSVLSFSPLLSVLSVYVLNELSEMHNL